MEKTCTVCKQSKLLECFHKKSKSKDGRQNICKQCTKNCSRAYYAAHTEDHKKTTREKRKQERAESLVFVRGIKARYGCQLCVEKEACCLEFHHVDGEKEFNVGDFRALGVGRAKFIEEIRKCVVLCSNCHKKVHEGLISIDLVAQLVRATDF